MMKRKLTSYLAWVLVLSLFVLVGCEQEQIDPYGVDLHVEVAMANDFSYLGPGGVQVVVRNTKTGVSDTAITDSRGEVHFRVEEGLYDVQAVRTLRREQVILYFQQGLSAKAVFGSRVQLHLDLKTATVPNQDYDPDAGYIYLTFRMQIPPPYDTISPENISVRAVHQLLAERTEALTDKEGEVTMRLREGVYDFFFLKEVDDETENKVYVLADTLRKVDPAKFRPEGNKDSLSAPYEVQLQGTSRRMQPKGEVRIIPTLPPPYTDLPFDFELNIRDQVSQRSYTGYADTGAMLFTIPHSRYEVFAVATVSLRDEARVVSLSASKKFSVSDEAITIELPLNVFAVASAWVIQELYFTGCQTPAGRGYWADQYITLYNNSGDTLYADRICLSESYENTQVGNNRWGEYKPNPVAQFIFQIPGDGTQHPVPPGGTFLIANQGLDHRKVNKNSIVDMSGADYEWYEEDKRNQDIDVPECPNMLLWYRYTKSITVFHTRGYSPYFIWRPKGSMEDFLAQHEAATVFPSGRTIHAYHVPIELILDAVQTGPPAGPKWLSFPPEVDAGYTYCDGSYIMKSVRRKVSHKIGNRFVLQDTNNSTDDFMTNRTPQPRVIDAID